MKFLLFAIAAVILWYLFKGAFARKSGMSVAEAAKLLAITEEATPEDVLAAHRRLIARVHPDAGGTAELAAQVNQARDVLLSHATRLQDQ
jgi:DnaJ homolog subfamily C member 19